jgi:hypothetical protein
VQLQSGIADDDSTYEDDVAQLEHGAAGYAAHVVHAETTGLNTAVGA